EAIQFVRMQRCIRSDLDPALGPLVKDVYERQLLSSLLSALDDVDVEDEGRDRRVAIEHGVEVGDFEADHALPFRRPGVEGRFFHVAVEAANHVPRPRREAAPIVAVRRAKPGDVLVDEALTDAFYISPHRPTAR